MLAPKWEQKETNPTFQSSARSVGRRQFRLLFGPAQFVSTDVKKVTSLLLSQSEMKDRRDEKTIDSPPAFS
jgi:hypothetical protein